jgi:hypothetical protein
MVQALMSLSSPTATAHGFSAQAQSSEQILKALFKSA